ncbi:glycosyltransferase family 2 protein [Hydrogenophaga sp.]|uniref:glycosyltransferase family A protein n=1 Tax=Hydrogenophaga sp. TaxID=1904254 RepID=UPI0019CDF0C0|nr:glycosyltransferase family 2 protein [Hydrogenophaga sp.]MBD3893563.1 glycosyltransferase family 2 protein [Hydrogenophaga sp.]
MSKISIAVVIPAFNAEHFIVRALDSVLRQTHLPDELLVVDDGSTDQTAELARSHAVAQSIPTRVLQQENSGLAATRNLAIRSAVSTHIALLDADDEFEPEHIEFLHLAQQQFPAATLYFSAMRREFHVTAPDSERVSLPDFRLLALRHCSSSDAATVRPMNSSILSALLGGNFIPTSGAMFPRSIGGSLTLHDDSLRFAEDRELFVRLAALGQLIFIDRVGCIIHRHAGNMSGPRKQYSQALAVLKVLEMIRNKNILALDPAAGSRLQELLSNQSEVLLYFAPTQGFSATVAACRTYLRYARHPKIHLMPKAFLRLLA